MCGIAGILHFDGVRRRDAIVLERMLDSLAYRGPDGRGVHLSLPDLSMGVVRLAITDKTGSDQPLRNETGSIQMVFNGEIYNYLELRHHLIDKGHYFNTDGDGEVIIHLYEEDPSGFAAQLDGMFAFALWDKERRQLVLCRDRCGIKPLLYWRDGNRLVFASEIKALFKDMSVPLEIDPEAVAQYMAVRFVLPPRTIYSGIRKLEPGTTLCIKPDGSTARRFWNFVDPSSAGGESDGLASVLQRAVETTSASDSEIGLFLSGGIDSSSVAGFLAAKKKPKTFSVGYEVAMDEDERCYAGQVSKRLGLINQEVCVTEDSVLRLLGKTIWHLEEPIYTPVIISTYAVSQLAASQLRIVLSGDGSDELLFGYRHFRLSQRPAETEAHWRRTYLDYIGWLPHRWRRLIIQEAPADAEMAERIFADAPSQLEPADQMRWFEFRYKLPEYHLTRVDRLSMAHGLEVRVPFLRNEMVDWALAQPGAVLLNGEREKAQLRAAVKDFLPASIMARRKQKFSAPFRNWIAGALNEEVRGLLLDSGYHKNFGLSRAGLLQLVRQFTESTADSAPSLWGIFILFFWHDRVFRRLTKERVN